MIDLYHCGQREGVNGIFKVCVSVCMSGCECVWLVGLNACLCVFPSLMHGQRVSLVLFLSLCNYHLYEM